MKFRAWNTKKLKMYNSIEELYYENGVLEEVIFSKRGIHGEEDVKWEHVEFVELMQYTGLHDSYGVEIYEGDKIHLDIPDSYGSYNYNNIGVVIFKAGSFMVDWGEISDLLYGIHLDAVVKGNIYENPELV